jgi:hypothetical protein
VRWRLSTTMAGALAPRTLAIVTISSHSKQWDRASFEIRVEEGYCRSNLLKIEIAE